MEGQGDGRGARIPATMTCLSQLRLEPLLGALGADWDCGNLQREGTPPPSEMDWSFLQRIEHAAHEQNRSGWLIVEEVEERPLCLDQKRERFIAAIRCDAGIF